MEQIHFVGANFPISVYGSSVFHCFGRTSVVVGSRCQVQMISPITSDTGVLQWVSEELTLPYFNAATDNIVAVDSFVHAQTGFPIIGVSGVWGQTGSKAFFAIHTGIKSNSKELFYEFEHTVIDLSFVPLKLTHTEIQVSGIPTRAFLLSGNDEQIHLYIEDKKSKEFKEVLLTTHFPEIVNVASSALSIDIQYNGKLRIIALGYQSGFVALTVFDESAESQVSSATIMLDGPISAVKMYSPDPYSNFANYLNRSKTPHIHPSLEDFDKFSRAKRTIQPDSNVHLVVCGTLGFVIVFRNVLHDGLKNWEVLPYPQSSDSATCACVLDWDMDGTKEVCVGSYGKTVSVFKEMPCDSGMYRMAGRFHFPQPVECILPCNVTQDGLAALAVFCFSGIHFIRPMLSVAKRKIEEGLKLVQEKRTLERLLKEEMEKITNLKVQLDET